MISLALVPVILVSLVVADIAIALIGGGKYVHSPAANIFRIFMVLSFLYPADRFIAVSLDVIHQPRINFIKVMVMLVLNIITDFAGIYLFGNVYGIAIPSIVPALAGIWISYRAMQRYQRFTFRGMYVLGYQELSHLIRETLIRLKVLRVSKS